MPSPENPSKDSVRPGVATGVSQPNGGTRPDDSYEARLDAAEAEARSMKGGYNIGADGKRRCIARPVNYTTVATKHRVLIGDLNKRMHRKDIPVCSTCQQALKQGKGITRTT